MRISVLIATLFCASLQAQGTFRIFDSQMNDVTSGLMFVADTNASQILCDLSVENTDTIQHDVTAGRLVLNSPVTASNAFIWGMNQYPPGADSSVVSEIMQPAGTQVFQGLYFPNSNGGIATINYCFWERTDMNNNSCLTVTFENHFPAGMNAPLAPPAVYCGPNPALSEIGVGWSGWKYTTVNLYASDGTLVESRDVRGQNECGFDLRNLPGGIYLISCIDDYGRVSNSRFVH